MNQPRGIPTSSYFYLHGKYCLEGNLVILAKLIQFNILWKELTSTSLRFGETTKSAESFDYQ